MFKIFVCLFFLVHLFSTVHGKEELFTKERVCRDNNKKPGAKTKDCIGELFNSMNKEKDPQVYWDTAEYVRSQISLLHSLKFYVQALKKKKTEMLCIEDGINQSLMSAFNLPGTSRQDKQFLNSAYQIAFDICVDEHLPDLKMSIESKGKGYFKKNVCKGLKSSGRKFKPCG